MTGGNDAEAGDEEGNDVKGDDVDGGDEAPVDDGVIGDPSISRSDDVPASLQPRSPAENAELAMLLEVAGTPKPGNVDRRRDLDGLRFEHFLAGAVGADEGLRLAEAGAPIGGAFERAVAGMSRQSGGNTQFGCLLLLIPLVKAAAAVDTGSAGRTETVASDPDETAAPESDERDATGRDHLSTDVLREIVESTTVDDAVGFYRAFDRVDVAVDDPPADADELDVRRGADAVPALREREVTLYEVMRLSANPPDGVADGNAVEWTTGFRRTFEEADAILDDDGPATDRAARAFLRLLADRPDGLVATQHGPEVAEAVSDRAAAVVGDLDAAETLATEFVAEGINPGTTADATCAALFLALERGLEV